jgi:hypothetical protein
VLTLPANLGLLPTGVSPLPGLLFPPLQLPPLPILPPAPPAPTQPPPNLPTLQYVNPGDVIRSADFNALVATVQQLANVLGVKPQLGQTLVSVYPVFFPTHTADGTQQPVWLNGGRSARAPAGGSATGMTPVQLPDGLRVTGLTVQGDKTGTVSSFTVTLSRVWTSSEKSESIAVKDLNDGTPFGDAAEPTGNDQLVLVNNDKYSYVLTADVKGATGTMPSIRGIKITLAG